MAARPWPYSNRSRMQERLAPRAYAVLLYMFIPPCESKVCVLGNHDKELKDARLRQLFVEVCDRKEIIDNYNGISQKLVLLHSPEIFWNGQHKGSILLYGHLHMSDEWKVYKKLLNDVNDYFKDKTLKGYTDCPPIKAYNVGAMLDYMNYTPRTLKEILAAHENN